MPINRPAAPATRWLAALLVTTSTAACGAWPYGSGDLDVALHAVFRGGARALQAVTAPYAVADVAHLYLDVYRVDGVDAGETETPLQDAQGAAVTLHIARDGATLVDAPSVRLGGLRRDTHYRIKARAYTAGDESTGTLISDGGAGCLTDLTVAHTEAATVVQAAIQVQLGPRTFDGKAKGTLVEITPGGFSHVAPAVTF